MSTTKHLKHLKNLKIDEVDENIEELEVVVDDVFPALVGTVVVSLIILGIFLSRLYIRWSVDCSSKNKMTGKTIVITGANTGLGRATATELAKRGGRVILACRDKVKGEAVARTIRRKVNNQNVIAMKCDLGNLRAIKDFATELCENEREVNVLINNAAYMGPKGSTADGLEKCFGVNYLGHFYLTWLLQEKLRKSAPARIINVTSDSYVKGKLDFDDLAMTKSYTIFDAYCRSKLAMVVFNQECHRHYSTGVIFSYAVHPGAVSTDLLRNWPGLTGNILRAASRVLFKSPEQGCQTIVHCAIADKIREHSGKLFVNCRQTKVKDFVKDKELGKKLWNVSLHLCGLDSEIVEDPEPDVAAAGATEIPEAAKAAKEAERPAAPQPSKPASQPQQAQQPSASAQSNENQE
ncbi:retinol dehydrogenase 12 [Patella vulgata]|uniref:retinol dehydrogenase 12 n=1 Tax=Patella vulgata TaxID=6465 RepID=UPI002180067B|nr:retinol dehydrogenase 12 [Patella vulgata]